MSYKIRVKRKGSGSLKVSIDPADEGIGKVATTIYFVRRIDTNPSDPGDLFHFDPKKPLVFEEGAFFNIVDIKPKKVTVEYLGSSGTHDFKVHIYVVDDREDGKGRPIVSDGSATIKNH
jgi:hypothetical protein